MKPELEIDNETGACYFRISREEVVHTTELSQMPVVLMDLDKKGKIVGIEYLPNS